MTDAACGFTAPHPPHIYNSPRGSLEHHKNLSCDGAPVDSLSELSEVEFEYGIGFYRHEDWRSDPHRSRMTREQALQFIREWREDGGKPDAFFVIRRPIGVWEKL